MLVAGDEGNGGCGNRASICFPIFMQNKKASIRCISNRHMTHCSLALGSDATTEDLWNLSHNVMLI